MTVRRLPASIAVCSPPQPQPEDASIVAFAASGDVVLVGAAGDLGPGGVFRSTDHGESFESGNSGLAARFIDAIAVDPARPGVLLAHHALQLHRSTKAPGCG